MGKSLVFIKKFESKGFPNEKTTKIFEKKSLESWFFILNFKKIKSVFLKMSTSHFTYN